MQQAHRERVLQRCVQIADAALLALALGSIGQNVALSGSETILAQLCILANLSGSLKIEVAMSDHGRNYRELCAGLLAVLR